VTNNLAPDLSLLTGAIHIPDSESIKMVYRLLDEEGLYVGASSALNVVAATELAKKKGKGSTVVTILCDGAYRCVERSFEFRERLLTAGIGIKRDYSLECGWNRRILFDISRRSCKSSTLFFLRPGFLVTHVSSISRVARIARSGI